MQHFHAIILSIFSFFSPHKQIKMIPANSIAGLQQVIIKVQKKTKLPVIFPKKIPYDPKIKTYYASTYLTNIPYGVNYIINVDRTKKCHGAHYCNIGKLQTEKKADPRIYHDMNNKEITAPVKLALNHKGYFTPSHAMGDYWPAIIQWRDKDVLYILSWNIDKAKEKTALIKMANSIITQNK